MKKKLLYALAALVVALSMVYFGACSDDGGGGDDDSGSVQGEDTSSTVTEEVIEEIDTSEVTVSSTPELLVDASTVAKVIEAGGTLYICFTTDSVDCESAWLSVHSGHRRLR